MNSLNHPAELAIHSYLEGVVNNKATFSSENAAQVAEDVREAVLRQFNRTEPKGFRLRMSNVGRPYCQLWFEKNKPETAMPRPTTFVMNMMLGDIIEAVFKGILREARVKYQDSERVTLPLKNANIDGTYDLIIDEAVDDVKSASDWSYKNKFQSYEVLKDNDSFGYVGQLAGYAKAADKRAGGWWVVNKATGEFKYIPADGIDVEAEVAKIEETCNTVEENAFKRCYEAEPEMFRGKPTGNKILNTHCGFCSYRHDCWPTLQEKPAVKSQAKLPKITNYVELAEEYR